MQWSLPHTSGTVFKPHPQSETRKLSATILIKYLLALKNPEILPTHVVQLLRVLLWKVTEAEGGKHKTRFQSQGAIDCSDKSHLRHDHVFPRAKMIAALKKAAPGKVADILKRAIGCTVTKKEHARLSKFDKECDGWDRYKKAGVRVIDTQTSKRVIKKRVK